MNPRAHTFIGVISPEHLPAQPPRRDGQHRLRHHILPHLDLQGTTGLLELSCLTPDWHLYILEDCNDDITISDTAHSRTSI